MIYSIYIVDDEQTIREGVSMALEADYQVETFSTAETAIDAMEKWASRPCPAGHRIAGHGRD